jgi:hypothetical protein
MNRYIFHGLERVMAAAVLALWSVAWAAGAQNGTPNGKPTCIGCSIDGKTTPRMPDGRPDLDGFWDDRDGGGIDLGARFADGSVLFDLAGKLGKNSTPSRPARGAGGGTDSAPTLNPSYKPEYMAKVKGIAATMYGDTTPLDPQMDCTPLGVPRSMFRGAGRLYGAFQIVQTSQVVAILLESSQGMNYRVIYMDGRGHPKDLDTSYLGDSIGHWEGDALVVDVVGLNDDTWLGGGQSAPPLALIHSDREHVTERLTRNGDVLTYEATVEDPVMFTKPWIMIPRQTHHASAEDRLLEMTCTPNDKSHIIKPSEADPYTCYYCIPDKTPRQ